MAHYLVTGAAGFIGSRVAALLLADGHTVTALDNLNDAYDVRLKHWRLALLQDHTGFRFSQMDLGDRDGLQHVFTQPLLPDAGGKADLGQPPFDAVINLAARAGVRYSVEDPWVYFDTNVIGTLNLLEMCRHHGVSKFVLSSSSSVYGQSSALPYREDQSTDHPLSPYAASKKAAEALCATYHYLYGIDTTVFRYFTVYGPAGRPDMMPFRLVQWVSEGRPVKVYGDGSQSRDFTYVDDIARGTIAGLKPLGYEIINLGGDRPAVLMDVIRLVERLTGREARLVHEPVHPADVKATWADIEKARHLLGWEPHITVEAGMARLVEWYAENRSWAEDVITSG